MDTEPIPLSVENSFWDALETDDIALAEELLIKAMDGDSYCDKGEMVYDNSILHDHIGKYVTGFRTTHRDDTVKIDEIEFKVDKLGGSMYISYLASAYFGCKDMNVCEKQDAVIDFIIDPLKRMVIVFVLKYCQRSDEDAEWAVE